MSWALLFFLFSRWGYWGLALSHHVFKVSIYTQAVWLERLCCWMIFLTFLSPPLLHSCGREYTASQSSLFHLWQYIKGMKWSGKYTFQQQELELIIGEELNLLNTLGGVTSFGGAEEDEEQSERTSSYIVLHKILRGNCGSGTGERRRSRKKDLRELAEYQCPWGWVDSEEVLRVKWL